MFFFKPSRIYVELYPHGTAATHCLGAPDRSKTIRQKIRRCRRCSRVRAGSATATPMTDASGQKKISLFDAILAARLIRRGHRGPGPVRCRKMATLAWRLAGEAATATCTRARQDLPQLAAQPTAVSVQGHSRKRRKCARRARRSRLQTTATDWNTLPMHSPVVY